MRLTKEEVEHIAWLARLSLTEEEKQRFTRQLGDILTHFQELQTLDTGAVDPTSHPLPLSNVFREDEVRPSLEREDALANAPERHDRFFSVPRILEE